MRATLAAWCVGLAFAFVALAGVQAQTWVEVRPEGGAYRVSMPGAAKFTQVPIKMPDGSAVPMHQALYETADMALLSSHLDYPAEFIRGRAPEQLLMNVRDGSAKGHKLRSDRALTVSGHPAREYVVVQERGIVSTTRSTLVGNRLYQVIAVVLAGGEANPDIRKFIDSFVLAPR